MAEAFRVDAGRLRPTDRFDAELAPPDNSVGDEFEDYIDYCSVLVPKRFWPNAPLLTLGESIHWLVDAERVIAAERAG
jgi:hypothetical protein